MEKPQELRETMESHIRPKQKRREPAWRIHSAPRPVLGQLSFDLNIDTQKKGEEDNR